MILLSVKKKFKEWVEFLDFKKFSKYVKKYRNVERQVCEKCGKEYDEDEDLYYYHNSSLEWCHDGQLESKNNYYHDQPFTITNSYYACVACGRKTQNKIVTTETISCAGCHKEINKGAEYQICDGGVTGHKECCQIKKETKHNCCGNPEGSKGCKLSDELMWSCCKNVEIHVGCKQKYGCCGGDPLSKGCQSCYPY